MENGKGGVVFDEYGLKLLKIIIKKQKTVQTTDLLLYNEIQANTSLRAQDWQVE